MSDTQSVSTPEEYKVATGKRFRMTKEQKSRGLTRQEAFNEYVSGQSIPARNSANC